MQSVTNKNYKKASSLSSWNIPLCAAGCNQPARHHQQPDPGEEVRLRGVWRPAGRLSGVLGHIRSACVQNVNWLKTRRVFCNRKCHQIMPVVCLQTCPAPPQVRMGRSSTSSDLRSISKLHLFSLLTSSKSFSTRTPIYLSVPPSIYKFNSFLGPWTELHLLLFTIFSLFAVWPCPAAWTQPRHAKPPLCSLH